MDKNLDKIVIFGLSLAVYCMMTKGDYIVVPVIVAVVLSCLVAFFKNIKIKGALLIACSIACVVYPPFVLFLPLICYEFSDEWMKCCGVCALVLIILFISGNISYAVFSIPLIAVSFLMSVRTNTLRKSKLEFCRMQDDTREDLIKMQEKYKELLERQDYQLSVATLSERNRIARDIHDSVGHILSRSLLQVGAMEALSQDKDEKERLGLLKDSLTDGMNSIRSSLHNLYDESIDLYAQVKGLCDEFTFCKITFDYDMKGNPDRKIKYAFIAIVKEALTNIQKHSKATSAKVTLREMPAFFVLSISDNGIGIKKSETPDGIGMRSIETRVNDIGGNLNIICEKGFKIYISVPKE